MNSNIHPVEAEELMAYLDGELPVERASATAAHLRDCRECQIMAAEFKSVSESLTAWEIPPKDAQISPELEAALDERQDQSEKMAPSPRWTWMSRDRFRPFAGGALAGGAAMLLAIALLYSETRPRNFSPENAVTIRRPEADISAATAPDGSPGSDRDRLTLNANMSDADRALRAQRLAQAGISSKLYMEAPPADSARTKATTASPVAPSAPMVLRTAQLTVVTQNLDKARVGLDQVVKRYNGYVGDLSISAPNDSAHQLTANLRIPAAQMDAAMAELKALGRVESESQNGQDVTAQYVDLEARLSNSRNTEQRLTDLLKQRTGKLSDVLEVETEISRVREEVERMEGERRLLSKQVEYATVSTTISEEYKAPASALPASLGTRFRNAAVEGYQSVVNFAIDIALFFIANGPMLLLWIAILFFPARYAWRKFRNRELLLSK